MQQATQRPLSSSEQNSYQPQHTPDLQDKAETLQPHPQHKPSMNKETAVQQPATDKTMSHHIPRLRTVVESQAFKNILVDEMDMMLSRAATLIQASWRGYQLRQKLTSQMMAAKSIQEAWRRFNTRRLLRSGRAVGKKVSVEEKDIPYHPPQQVRFQTLGEGKSLPAQPVMISKETQFPSNDTLATLATQVTPPPPQGTPQVGMQTPYAAGSSGVTFLPHQTTAIRLPCPEAKCLLTRTIRSACLAHHVEGDMVKTKQITTKTNKAGTSGPPPSGKYVQAVHGPLKTHVGSEVKTLPQKDTVPVIAKTPAQSSPVPTVAITKTPLQTYPVTKTPPPPCPVPMITITKTATRPCPTTLVAKAPPQTCPTSTVTKIPFQSCLVATMTKTPPQTCPPAIMTKIPPHMCLPATMTKTPPQTCPPAIITKTSFQTCPPATMTKIPLQTCLAAMMNRIPTLPCPVPEMTITKTAPLIHPPPTMAKVPLQPCPVAPMTKTPAQTQPTAPMTNTPIQTQPAAMVTKFPPQICLLASMIKPPPQTRPTAMKTKTPPQTCPVTGMAKTPAQTHVASTSAKTTVQTGRVVTITKTPSQMPPGPLLTKTPPQTRLAAMITKTPAQLRSVATILRTLCLPPPAGGNLKAPPTAAGGIPNTSSHTCLNGPKAKSVVTARQVVGMTKISSHSCLTEGKAKYCPEPQLGAGTSKTPASSPLEVEKTKALPQKQIKTVSNTCVTMHTTKASPCGKVTEGRKLSSQALLKTDVVKVQSQVFVPVETAVILPQEPVTTCPAKSQPQAQLATYPTTTLSQTHPLAELTKVLSQGHPSTKLATALAQSPLGACLSKVQSQGDMPPKLAKAPSLAHLGTCLTKAQSQAHLVTGVMKVQSQAYLPIQLTKAQSQAQLVTETAKCLYAAHQPAELSSKTQSQPLLAGLKASTQPCQPVGCALPQAKLDDRLTQLPVNSYTQAKTTQDPCQGGPETQSMLVPLLASAGHPTCNVESWGDSGKVRAQSSTASPATPCQEELAASQLASLCAELAAVLGSHEDLRTLLAKALSQGEVRTVLNQALSKEVLTTTMTKALPQGMLGTALVKALSWGELGIALSRALSRGELRAELTKAMQGKLAEVLSKALTEEERAALSQALCQGELGAVLGQSLSQAALRTGVILPKATSKLGSGMTMMPTPVEVDYRGSQSAPWGPTLCPVRPQPSKVRVPEDGVWEGCIQGCPTGFLAEMGDGVMLMGSSCWSVVSVCASSRGRVIATVHQCPLSTTLGPTLSWGPRSCKYATSNLSLSPKANEKNAYLLLGASKLARDSAPKLPKSPHPQPPPSLWQPLIANGAGPSTSQPSVASGPGPRSHKPHMVSRVAPHSWVSSGASLGTPGKLPATSGNGSPAHTHQCAAGYVGAACWCRPSNVCRTLVVKGPEQQSPMVPEGTVQSTQPPNHKWAHVGTREINNKVTPSPPLAVKKRKMPLTQPQASAACDKSPSVSMASDQHCALKSQLDPSLFTASAGSRLAPSLPWAALPRKGRTRTRTSIPGIKCPQDHMPGHILSELTVSLSQGSDCDVTGSFSQGSVAQGPNVSSSQSSAWSCSSLSPSTMSVAGLTAVAQGEEGSWEASLGRNLQLESPLTSEALGRVQGPGEVKVAERGAHRPLIPTLHHQSAPASETIPILNCNSVPSCVTFSVHWGSADQDDINIGSDQCSVGWNKSSPQGPCKTGLRRSLSLGDLVLTKHQHSSVASRLTSNLYQPVTGKVGPTLNQPYMAIEVTPSLSYPSISRKGIPCLGHSSKATQVAFSVSQISGVSGVPPSGNQAESTSEVGSGPAQPSVTSGVNPTLAQPSKASESAPYLSQSSVISGLNPSSAQSSVIDRVTPSVAQASVSGGVAPSLTQASVIGGVAPSLTQTSVSDRVTPSVAQASVSGGVASSSVELSVTGGVTPSLSQPSESGEVASSLAQPSVTSAVAPSLAQPSMISVVAPNLAQPSVTGEVPPSLTQPFMTIGVVPHLVQPSMTDGVALSLTLPTMTGGVGGLGHPSMVSGVMPNLVQPSVTGRVFPSLVQSSMTSGVAPSLEYPALVCGVTHSLAKPPVASRGSPRLIHPSVTTRRTSRTSQPSTVSGMGRVLRQPRVAPQVGSNLSSSISSVTWRQHHPSFLVEVSSSRPYPSATGSMAQGPSQPSVNTGVDTCKSPLMLSGVTSNLQAPEFNELSLRFHQPLDVGRHVPVAEHSAITISVPNIYPASVASGESGLGQESGVSQGIQFRGLAASMSHGATTAGVLPNMSQGTLTAGMVRNVCQRNVVTGMGQSEVAGDIVPITSQASAAGVPLIPEQISEMCPRFPWASVPDGISMSSSSFPLAGVCPNMSQVSGDLPVHVDQQHPPVSTTVTANYQQTNAVSQESVLGKVRDLVSGSAASKRTMAMDPGTVASGMAPSLSPKSMIRNMGKSAPPRSRVSAVAPGLPPDYTVNSEVAQCLPPGYAQCLPPGYAQCLHPGSMVSGIGQGLLPGSVIGGINQCLPPGSVTGGISQCSPPGPVVSGIGQYLPPGSVINGIGQGLPPGSGISGIVQCFPPGSVSSGVGQGLPPESVVGGTAQLIHPGAAVSGTAKTLPPAPVVSGLGQRVPSNLMASTMLPASMTGGVNQGLDVGPMAPASRSMNQSPPQGSMLIGITPRPYLGALAGEGTASPIRASHNMGLAQAHPQTLEASGTAKDVNQESMVLQRAEQLNQILGIMPFETTDGQIMVKPDDQEEGLSQECGCSVGSDKPVILEGTPWMYLNPMVTDLDSSPELLAEDGALPIGHRPLLQEVVPRQVKSMASGLAPGPPQHSSFVKNSMAGNVAITLQHESATICGVPSSHSVAVSRVPSAQRASVKDTGDSLVRQEAPVGPVMSQSPSAHQQASGVPIVSQSPSGHQRVLVGPAMSMAPAVPQHPSAHQQVPVAPVAHQSPAVLRQVSVAHIEPWSGSHGMVGSPDVSRPSKLAHGRSVAPSMHTKSVIGMRTPSPSQRLGTTDLASQMPPYPSRASGAAAGRLQTETIPSALQKPVSGGLTPRRHESVRPWKSYKSIHSGLVPEILDSSVAKTVPSHSGRESASRSPLVGSKCFTGAPPGLMPIIHTEGKARGPATSKLHGGVRKVSLGYASTPNGSRRSLLRQESLLESLDSKVSAAHPKASLTPAVLQGPVDAGMAGGQARNSTAPTVAVGPVSGTVAPGGAWEPPRGIVPWGTAGSEAAVDPRQSDQLMASVQAVEKIIIQAVITIQACARGYLVRRTIKVWHQWAVIIQAAWRGYCVRRDLLRLTKAATIIQAAWRGFHFRHSQACQMLHPSMWVETGSGTRAMSDHRCFQSCQPHICTLCQSLTSGLGSTPSVVMLVGSSPRTCHKCGQTLPTRVVHGMGQGGSGLALGHSRHLIPRTSQHPHCQNKAAIAIQAAWRGFLVRRQLRQQQQAAKMLQATWRGHRTRSSLSTDALLGSASWDNPQHMQWPGV
ncbi:IQ domain-containing protein N isoform X1 [Talpa occidentalis]|uniref:IQ domain-containing protein N isoform X1 n=1 Tax=Talpa occidentalis TaxID=50954 RepID=UPI0018900E7F|nr:IQ domain-containing protein N isoform X1 [Talpa occidentalis]